MLILDAFTFSWITTKGCLFQKLKHLCNSNYLFNRTNKLSQREWGAECIAEALRELIDKVSENKYDTIASLPTSCVTLKAQCHVEEFYEV